MAPFPWADVLHVGLCLLRLDPERFWRLSPCEFHALAGGLAPKPERLDRDRLDGLMTLFPDGT